MQRTVPVFPSLTIDRGFPTVNGIRYWTFADALEAKRKAVEYWTIDLFGQPLDYNPWPKR